MFRLRRAQQDQLARYLTGAHLARGFRRRAKDAFFEPDTGQVCVVGGRDQRSYLQLDPAGRIVKTTTPLGRVTELGFTGGRLSRTVQPTGLTTDIEYADGGLTRRFQRSDGARTELRLDARGHLKELTAPNGSKVRMRHDAGGRVTDRTERDGTEVHRDHDERGRLVRVVDPLGRVTRLRYGDGDRPERIVYPNGRVESYRYTETTTTQLIGDAPIAEFRSDAAGRLVGADYAGGRKLSFDYDDAGKLTAASSEDGEVEVGYDDQGRTIADDQDGRVVRYAYDADGQIESMTLPSGEVVSYTYDLDGRLLTVRDWNGGVQRFAYGPGDAPVSRTLPSGLLERTVYDEAGNVAAVQVDAQVRPLWYQSYARDALDRIVERTDSRHGRHRYEYGARGQLVAVTNAGTGQLDEYYSYDAAGCRVRSDAGDARFDMLNRPVAASGARFRHDALGNRASRTDAAGTTRYTFGRTNLLTRAVLPDGSVVKYFYDAFSRRIRKVTKDAVTTYVWAGHQLVQEIIEENGETSTREYLYAPGTFRPLAMRFRGDVFYYHTDPLGTPQVLTDSLGNVAWSARYHSFGEASPELERIPQPLRFPGQYRDAETGLHYNRARYYDPALGTYLSPDPDAPVAGSNLYEYADGDPINEADPYGLFSWGNVAATVGGLAVGIAAGIAVTAAVVALAPVGAAVGTVALVAGAIGILAGGALGGAAAGGIGAAIDGGCVPCAMKNGAISGLVAAVPFVAAEALGLAGAAAIAVASAAGALGGALGYGMDCVLNDREPDAGELLTAVALGAALGGLGKYIGGKFAGGEGEGGAGGKGKGGGAGEPGEAAAGGEGGRAGEAGEAGKAGEGETTEPAEGPKGDPAEEPAANPAPDEATPSEEAADESDIPPDERPTKPPPPPEEEEPPPVPPDEIPPPKTDGKYADDTVEMTGTGKRVDEKYPVQIYDEQQLEAHRVVASKDGRMIYAQSGEPVNTTDGKGIYVMDKDGNVYVHEQSQFGEIHHSTLAGGEDPVGGGQLIVENGRVVSMDESTGHYGANMEPGTAQKIADELSSQGVDMSETNVQSHPK